MVRKETTERWWPVPPPPCPIPRCLQEGLGKVRGVGTATGLWRVGALGAKGLPVRRRGKRRSGATGWG